MAFYPALGYGIFWIGLITAIVLYSKFRKWYTIGYLVSVSMYIFTVGFVIDVFDLNRNYILLILALSTIIMMLLGFYMQRKFSE